MILLFQLKHFEPIWGDGRLSNSNTSVSKASTPKQKKTETITAPVNTPPVTTIVKMNTRTTCSTSDNIEKDKIKLELPIDNVDSTTDSTIVKPIVEDVVLPNVRI